MAERRNESFRKKLTGLNNQKSFERRATFRTAKRKERRKWRLLINASSGPGV